MRKITKNEWISIAKNSILLIADVVLFNFANLFIYYAVTGGKIASSEYADVALSPLHIAVISFMVIIINYYFKLYKSVWLFAGLEEMLSCFKTSVFNTLFLFIVDKIFFGIIGKKNTLPIYLYILIFILTVFFTWGPRISFRTLRSETKKGVFSDFYGKSKKKQRNLKRVMIVGAGYTGNVIINDIRTNRYKRYTPVVAIDDDPAKKGKRLQGIKIAGNCDDIPKVADDYEVDEIVICMPSATTLRQQEVVKIAVTTGKVVKTTPSLQELLENKNSRRKVRNVDINDLLARDEVKLDIRVCKYLIDKTILVTGGGGSIGSEICRQCAKYQPSRIVIFDIYENCAFETQNELKDLYGDKINIDVRIGSVRDMYRLREVFEEFHPDVVFHAAAHKHVPLMEDSPCEAVKNNVFGTYNVALAADEFKVPKMVILSTDKAVNPTNVMGTTKRITEIIVQYMNQVSKNTRYAAVRFGNVLGSHGSVIPIFKKQIEQGGPVCVTHKDITRYFMTIPEAAQLVCQAGGIATGGEVFVLDMGEPVRIMDLAENIIKLSGFDIDEIGIKITGLRPGEKLYEELSREEELATRERTANKKIFVNHPTEIKKEYFEEMIESLKNVNEDNVREVLMKYVPNYHPAKND